MSSLLKVDQLVTDIAGTRVIDGVSFSVSAGETYALLGESGCGKSMTALSLMRLLPDGGRIAAGTVTLAGTDVRALPEHEMRSVRGGRMAMIFQEPMLALNPVMKVGDQIVEALALHRGLTGQPAWDAARGLLEAVGVPDPVRRLDSYPFELSGGLRQRMMIAMALAGEPELLIADEPTTALDVTIQAQVLDVLRRLKAVRGMGMLLITHDLGVVAENADRVGVMYVGKLVELAPRDRIFADPLHPYTKALLSAIPMPDPTLKRDRMILQGDVPSPVNPPAGCRFHTRCPFAVEKCKHQEPQLKELKPGQFAACWVAEEQIQKGQA